MKKIFILSMLTSFVMICSCQKQGSAAEQQLAQRKTELDTREAALDEREKALVERERAFAQREKAAANVRTIPPGVQGQTRDAAQIQAERDRRIQQLPSEIRALLSRTPPATPPATPEKERLMQKPRAPRTPRPK